MSRWERAVVVAVGIGCTYAALIAVLVADQALTARRRRQAAR